MEKCRISTTWSIKKSRAIAKHFGGDYLLSPGNPNIIGLGVFHCCVRNGNRWDNTSIIATKKLNWRDLIYPEQAPHFAGRVEGKESKKVNGYKKAKI